MNLYKLKNHALLFCMVLFNFNSLYSQNLIQNGSFEEIDSTINYTTLFEVAFPWLGQSVDLYSTINLGYNLPTFPYFCKPVDGNNICGFILYNEGDREAIVGKLTQPLIANHKYQLSFCYMPQKKGYDKHFTIDYAFTEKMNPRGNSPYSVNDSLTCFQFTPERTRNWHLFESTFIPKGNENYIIIWHPKNDKLKGYFYYYFDDFKLFDLDATNTYRK